MLRSPDFANTTKYPRPPRPGVNLNSADASAAADTFGAASPISPVSPHRGVALHAARIGGGAAVAAVARGGGEAALAPVGVDLDLVAAALEFLHRGRRQPALDHQHARPRRARPERDRKMLGVPGRRV